MLWRLMIKQSCENYRLYWGKDQQHWTLESWKNTGCSHQFHLSHSACVTQSENIVMVLIMFAWRSLSPLHNKCLKTTGSLTMLLCQHLSRFLLQYDAPCQEAQAWFHGLECFHEQNRLFQSRAAWPLYTISVVCQPGSAFLVALTTSGSMLQ